MTLKKYLGVMGILTAICWGIFLFIARLVDPTATNLVGFVLFYISLFLALTGALALLGFVIRAIFKKDVPAFNLVKLAFRQSFLFSLFIVILLILKSQDLYNWLNLLLLVIIFTVLELFLSGYRHNR